MHAILIISETTALIKCHKFHSAWCFFRKRATWIIALNHFLLAVCFVFKLLATPLMTLAIAFCVYTLIMDMTFKWCWRSRKHEKCEWREIRSMMATRAGDYVRNKENNLINLMHEVEKKSKKLFENIEKKRLRWLIRKKPKNNVEIEIQFDLRIRTFNLWLFRGLLIIPLEFHSFLH